MRLDDGFSTTYELANLPGVQLYEKEVTPPGIAAGGPIDTTTMRNTEWRTQRPKQLKSLTQMTVTVAYSTGAFDEIDAQVGINQLITITFPDGSTRAFWGWIDEFQPGALVEGEQPTATMTIIPSNSNNATPPAEVAPVTEGQS